MNGPDDYADKRGMSVYAELETEDRDALQKVLQYLDLHSGFGRHLVKLAGADDWPDDWMSADEVHHEMQRRSFWSDDLRAQVPRVTRSMLVEHYLNTMTDNRSEQPSHGWCCHDGRYKYHQPEPDDDTDGDRRRHGRLRCELLSCQYGEVANISASGVMVLSRRRTILKVGDKVDLELQCLDETLELPAAVARIEKIKRRLHIGMQFVEMTHDTLHKLNQITRVAAICKAM